MQIYNFRLMLYRMKAASLVLPGFLFFWFTDAASPPVPAESVPAVPDTLHLVLAGDLMVHDEQLKSARQTDGTWRFDPVFTEIAPLLAGKTAWANLETVLWETPAVFHGYPRFRTPVAFAEAVHRAGFSGVWTSNNHSLDWGVKGIRETRRLLAQTSLTQQGVRADTSEAQGFRLFQFGQGLLATAAYTYGINGTIPDSVAWMIPVIDTVSIRKDLAVLQTERPPDVPVFTVVALHWGTEYDSLPSQSQIRIAEHLIRSGVDVVAGHHPHVIQPARWVKRESGDSGLVLFSLGNLISAQRTFPRAIGGLADIQILNHHGRFTMAGFRFWPTWVDSRGPVPWLIRRADLSAISAEPSPNRRKSLILARKHVAGILGDANVR